MKKRQSFLTKIFFTLTGVTLVLFLYMELLFFVYDPTISDPLSLRLYRAFFASEAIIIAIVLISLTSFFLTRYLLPLARAQNDQSLVELADKRLRRFYWLVFFVYQIIFSGGTILGVYLANAMHVLQYNLLVAFSASLTASSIIWQISGAVLAPVRRHLNLFTVKANQRDVSFTGRLGLLVVSTCMLYFATPIYIGHYYSTGKTCDAGPFALGLALSFLYLTALLVWQACFFSSFYLKAISSIKNTMKGLSTTGGNLSDRIPVSGYDEIGELASEFNKFMGFLNNEIMESLRRSSHTVFDSSYNLSASVQEITATSNEQAAAVKEIVTTMEDIAQIVQGASQRLGHIHELSQSTSERAADGVSSIYRSLDMFSSVKETTVTTISKVGALNEQLAVITEIVRMIEQIASQIRIIAFNASLEATSAGEAGRNFQVVADEVKRLADNTMASAKEIRSKVGLILSSADEVVRASRQSSEIIEEGWDIVAQLPLVFEGIQASAQESTTEIGQADLSAHQQVEAFEQVLATLKEISRGIENFTVSTRQTAATSGALKETAGHLSKIITRYAGV